jgi:hypothetical protein
MVLQDKIEEGLDKGWLEVFVKNLILFQISNDIHIYKVLYTLYMYISLIKVKF